MKSGLPKSLTLNMKGELSILSGFMGPKLCLNKGSAISLHTTATVVYLPDTNPSLLLHTPHIAYFQ